MSRADSSPLFALQQRVASAETFTVGPKTSAVFARLKEQLSEAVGAGLASSQFDVGNALKLSPDRLVICCGTSPTGPANFHRVQQAGNHLLRDDGAWFDFHLTFRDAAPATLIAYGFELRLPVSATSNPTSPAGDPTVQAAAISRLPPWIRYDLNRPGHTNHGRDLRSHLHPGHDDLQLPAPVLFPEELVHLCLTALRFDPDRKRRS